MCIRDSNITVRAIDTEDAYVDDTFRVDVNDAPTGPETQSTVSYTHLTLPTSDLV